MRLQLTRAVARGDPKGNQYSPLAEVHAANVHVLERAWEYKTGGANDRSTMHANPIGHVFGAVQSADGRQFDALLSLCGDPQNCEP